MKNLLTLLLILSSTLCYAGDRWYWLPARNGYYTRSCASGNDGWYYSRNASGQYVQTQQINNTTINIPPANWKVNLVNALSAQRENDYYLQALRESGLMPDQQANAYGQQSGYSTSTMYTQQGNGYHSLQSYAPNIGSVDIEGLIAKNARTIERMIDGTGQASAAMSDRIGQIIDGQNEALKINAAGAALVASIQATQVSKTTQTTTQTFAGPSQGQVPPEPTPAIQAQALPQVNALDFVRAEAVLAAKCAKCHTLDRKGDFSFNRIDQTNAAAIWGALNSHKKPMPPPDSGIAPLTPAELLTVSKAISAVVP